MAREHFRQWRPAKLVPSVEKRFQRPKLRGVTRKEIVRETNAKKRIEQPQPFTPGITKGMVRQHAFELYRDKLKQDEPLTLQDWVLAEKDLVQTTQSEGLETR